MRLKDRTGENRKMTCGDVATIIKYCSADDISVRFEDGTIVEHRQYSQFKRGGIQNPNTFSSNDRISNKLSKERIGMTHLASNGQMMTIIAYRGINDIDIKFEDGTIVTNKRYYNFLKGGIENPNVSINASTSLNEFVIYYYLNPFGFIRGKSGTLSNLGLDNYEIDLFHPQRKIGIEYDGQHWHQDVARDICKNNLCKENGILLYRIREPKLPSLKNSCLIYTLNSTQHFNKSFENALRNLCKDLNIDVDINFQRDHIDIMNQYYNLSDISRIGETNVANNGLKMKIVAYRNSRSIDVEFENGTIVNDVRYNSFLKGAILCPGTKKKPRVKDRTGECNTSVEGQKMKIVAYRNAEDIDVLFVDTNIVAKHRRYGNFKLGRIAMDESTIKTKFSRIGETNYSNSGELMKIIAYRNARDMDVIFPDGTISTNKTYYSFTMGKIAKPMVQNDC